MAGVTDPGCTSWFYTCMLPAAGQEFFQSGRGWGVGVRRQGREGRTFWKKFLFIHVLNMCKHNNQTRM